MISKIWYVFLSCGCDFYLKWYLGGNQPAGGLLHCFIQPCDPFSVAGALSFSWLALVTKASFSSLSILMTRWMFSWRSNSARMSFSSALLCTSSDYGMMQVDQHYAFLWFQNNIHGANFKWWHPEKTLKFGLRWLEWITYVVSDCIPHGSKIGKQICLNKHTKHAIIFSCCN